MVFGFFIDVPIIVGGFFLMLFYRRQLTKTLTRVPIPVFVTGIVSSVPLIILEEQIDCMRSWCGQVLIPPTLPFLLVEVIIVGLIAVRIHAASAIRVVSVYSVFGVLWEVFLGGLAGAPLVITLLFAPYVWIGYAFISLLPISVLLTKRSGIKASNASTPSSWSNPAEGSATLIAKQSRTHQPGRPMLLWTLRKEMSFRPLQS